MRKQWAFDFVYHLADARNWQSIQTHGLQCAAVLLEQNNLAQRINCQRLTNMQLPNGVIIRDQKPIPPNALTRCLVDGLTPAAWYAHLNKHVFFWIDLARLERQKNACTTPQYIMKIDAPKLLQQYTAQAALTPINTGNARRTPARRCLASFVPYLNWLNSGWAYEATALCTAPRARSHKPVELTIVGSVPNIFEFVVDVY